MIAQRERELIGRVAPTLVKRFDELLDEWRNAWATSSPTSAPLLDLPGLTRIALVDGVDAAIAVQRRMAEDVVRRQVPLDQVVAAVLLWEEIVLRRIARDAMEDIFTGASAMNRFLHGLVLMVAEGYAAAVREERDQVRRGLEDADRLKSDLISMVSHDLKTPLTTIQGCVASMLEASPDPEQQRRFLQMIRQNAERLSRLISQILDVSTIEARAMDLTVVELDPEPTIRKLVEGVLPTAPVRLDCVGHLPKVRADRDALERILVNLIDNAVPVSPPGRPVVIVVEEDMGEVEIRLIDSGPGIPVDRREQLFSKFYQVDPSPTGRRAGTGLGLAIVRALAEAMGGSAGFRPNPAGGSVFWVRLPAAKEDV